jgi:outer membrane protein OmpA-like peptidoglycan-associated protein
MHLAGPQFAFARLCAILFGLGRAEAVLAEKYGIDASNLVTVGYGKTQLKNRAGPFASENRRVQVINDSDK